MTRTAYAQLVGQKFYPPKIFPRWSEAEGTSEWRWRDVGMKIVSSQLYNLLAYDLVRFKRHVALRCYIRKAKADLQGRIRRRQQNHS